MALVAHTEHFLILLWISAGYLVQFGYGRAVSRSAPRVRVVHRPYSPLPSNRRRRREADEDEGPTLSMKPQTTVLINGEATKHDVDEWMEDLFARIELCLMHPHSVIQRDGTTNEEENNV